MLKIFERTALVEQEYKDVILLGKVIEITGPRLSKAGNKFVKLVLSNTYYDEDLEMDIDESSTVLFLDKPNAKYPSMDATNVAKLKLHEGSIVAVRANEVCGTDQNGDPEVTNFGSRASYISKGTYFKYKFSKKGNEAVVVIGTAVANELDGNKTLSIPLELWDKEAKENYTAWVNVSGDLLTEDLLTQLEPKPMVDANGEPVINDTTGKQKVHRPVICVVFESLEEVPDETNPSRTAAMRGEAKDITIANV